MKTFIDQYKETTSDSICELCKNLNLKLKDDSLKFRCGLNKFESNWIPEVQTCSHYKMKWFDVEFITSPILNKGSII